MLEEQCFPCGASGRACVLDASSEEEQLSQKVYRRRERVIVLDAWPEGKWFDVALWPVASALLPRYVAYVEAASAFEAIERLMRHYGFRWMERAAAASLDGLLLYRCFKVVLALPDVVSS